MAARVLKRHKLAPPYNLDELVSHYGNIEYHIFPIEADGISIGIGSENKPLVLINSRAPDTRKKFTLAHELGHIIIPWHIGTIVSHIDPKGSDFKYREMEQEANSFAAELLMPTDWILAHEEGLMSFEPFINQILESTGVSRDAVLIKIFNILNIPIACAQTDKDGRVIKMHLTSSAPKCNFVEGVNLNETEIFTNNHTHEAFALGDRFYKSWIFQDIKIEENDNRPWREIIQQILAETYQENSLKSINSILANAFQRNKSKTVPEIHSLVLRAFEGRRELATVINHPLFNQYIFKRVDELISKLAA